MLITQFAPQTEIHYPDSDGQPMAESDFQRVPLVYAVQALDVHLAANPDVYVSANLFLYYVEGHPEKVAAPDVFVAFGVEKRERKSYKIWEEGNLPSYQEMTIRAAQAQAEIERLRAKVEQLCQP